MQLKPLGKNIIFTFNEETSQGGFIPKTGGMIIVRQDMDHNRGAKWGQVFLTGPDVNPEDIKVGQYILIEPLQWTLGFEWEGVKYWKTDSTKVMIVSEVAVNSF